MISERLQAYQRAAYDAEDLKTAASRRFQDRERNITRAVAAYEDTADAIRDMKAAAVEAYTELIDAWVASLRLDRDLALNVRLQLDRERGQRQADETG